MVKATELIRLAHPEKGFIAVRPKTGGVYMANGYGWGFIGKRIIGEVDEWVAKRRADGYVTFHTWDLTKYAPKAPVERKGSRELSRIHRLAMTAGKKAATACQPVPMVVVQRANPFDDSSPIVRQYAPIEGGVCGFAWVAFPGNTEWGRWAKKNNVASAHYPSGLSIWIGDYGQSMARKEAHANAYAAVLREHGITAHAGSRMD